MSRKKPASDKKASDGHAARRKSPKRKRQVPKAYAPGDARRSKLIKSAEKLLNKLSILDVSYSDVASDAGLPLSSCYHFYRDKQDLLQALSEDLGERYRREVVGFYKPGLKFGHWEDLLDDHFERSVRFLESHPAAIEIWFSPHTPPVIRARTAERDRSSQLSFRPLLERYFQLPDIPNADDVFIVAKEIQDALASLAFRNPENLGFYRREAKLAIKSYLTAYFPLTLSPKPNEAADSAEDSARESVE